jgi:hypothetical protein
VLGTGGNGGIGIERGPSEEGSEALERQYDPLWANALTLLDYLTARDMIHDTTAGIGQFVNVSGDLRVHDMGTLQRFWDIPAVRKTMEPSPSGPVGNRSERRKHAAQPQAASAPSAIELGIELLKTLPHGVTARMKLPSGGEVWSSLHAASMTGSTSDLFLKHGANIAGTWNMIGVLDAEPDPDIVDDASPISPELQNAMGFLEKGFSHILDTLAPIARSFLGRPSNAYGMTPLVIYREVAR